ncbi:hypothetical protein KO481_04080 [Nocardia sp. NEAU-G5]|uniref:META domain-containing protein n=1 Tax=Nocardia albiluteola TaxID=2842303 RepID=A0ABS6AUR2_9NOCA|nr:hypothetical protein [Nocardia albiluteola]MBU3060700.1 hypothetical protein [Nocardia albiluteola]
MTSRTALAAFAVTGLLGGSAGVATAAPDDAAPYLGTWNYDQPDAATMTDVATMNLLGYTAQFPQIGTVTFSRGANGEVLGHTDQGCTWRFRVEPGALELASADQHCFNRIINSEYNIDRWRVQIDGNREREVLHANSYLAGQTFSFGLAEGRRTRAGITDRAETVRNFAGTWRFDPPDPARLVNLGTVAGAVPVPVPTAFSGTLNYRAGNGNTIVARTDDGCDWTLAADGNTAELSPPTQTCHGVARDFWSVAADGQRQTTIMEGTNPDGSRFLLTNGELSRP